MSEPVGTMNASGNNPPRRPSKPAVVRDVLPPRPSPLAPSRRLPPPRPQPPQIRPPGPERREAPDTVLPKAHREPTPREPPELILEQNLPVHTWEPERLKTRRRRMRLILATMAVVVAAGLIAPTVLFPKFTIIILPRIHSVSIKPTEITADPALTVVNPSLKKIPALIISLEKTMRDEYEATGNEFIREQAHGTIRIFNSFSSAPQILVASTRLQDPSGKIFRLHERVVIPGAEVVEGKIVPTSIAAEVVADAAGEEYNIAPMEFRIPGFRGTPKYQGFYGKSEKAFEGGFRGQAKVIQSMDLTHASEDITRRVYEAVEAELETKIPAGFDFFAPAGAREIVITATDQPRAGERAERFSTGATAKGRLIVVRRSHVTETISSLFVPNDSQLAAEMPANQNELTLGGARFPPGATQASIPVSGSLRYSRRLDLLELRETIRNSTPEKAEAYLRSQEEVESFRVKRFPAWLWFIPQRSGQLEVILEPPE